MVRSLRSLALSMAVLLAGCAGAPLYQPAAEPDEYGYRDIALSDDRYLVSFTGSYGTPRETVMTYLLYRAAEVTLDAGYDRFRVVSRDIEPTTEYRGYGGGFGHFGRFHDPFFSTTIGVTDVRPVTRYRAVAEIMVGAGTEGADPAAIYNAGEIKSRLDNRILRPAEE